MTRIRHHRCRSSRTTLGVVASTMMMMMMVIACNPLLFIQALSLQQQPQQRSYSRVKIMQRHRPGMHVSPALQLTLTMTTPTRATTALASSSSNGGSPEKPQRKVQWNLNPPGTSPFGFDRTAEVWNGRIAQVRTAYSYIVYRISIMFAVALHRTTLHRIISSVYCSLVSVIRCRKRRRNDNSSLTLPPCRCVPFFSFSPCSLYYLSVTVL